MRIYRRKPSKIWWVQWRGERHSLGTTDETAAQLKFRDMQRRDADPTYRESDPSATVETEVSAFITRQKERGRSPDTITMYELHKRRLCTVLGQHTPIAEVDAALIDRYVSVRTRDGASKSYRWKEICTLRGTLKRARKLGRYPYALDQVMPDDLQPGYEPLTRHLLMPDVMALLDELEPRRAAVVAFIVSTGADLGCVWRAEAGDVTESVALVRGTKNRHRLRTVPVLPIFAELAALARPPFAPWASCRRDLMRAATRAGVGPLVPGWTPLPAKEGQPPPKPARHITARDLRRTHGRILRAAGVDPHLIGPMLGHAPGSPVTAKSYAQIQPAELGALIEAQMVGAARRAGTVSVQRKRKTRKKAGKRRAA